MKRIMAMMCFLLALSIGASAEEWKNVSVVDQMCSAKAKASPDSHTKACAVQCQGSGFVVITDKGEVLALDKAGNEKFISQLKASKKSDKIRADVSGKKNGESITVEKITLL